MSETLNDGLLPVGDISSAAAPIPVLDAVPQPGQSATSVATPPAGDVVDFDAVADKIKATFEKLGIEVHDAWAEVVAVAKKV